MTALVRIGRGDDAYTAPLVDWIAAREAAWRAEAPLASIVTRRSALFWRLFDFLGDVVTLPAPPVDAPWVGGFSVHSVAAVPTPARGKVRTPCSTIDCLGWRADGSIWCAECRADIVTASAGWSPLAVAGDPLSAAGWCANGKCDNMRRDGSTLCATCDPATSPWLRAMQRAELEGLGRVATTGEQVTPRTGGTTVFQSYRDGL